MNDPHLTGNDAVSIVKYSALSLVFGMCLGAFGMVYVEQPKPQPVVDVLSLKSGNCETGQTWSVGPANNQRVKELRFSLHKLERLKDVHDATLREAATNQGDIRQMVKALEVGK
mgnify:CR=1 FL=1